MNRGFACWPAARLAAATSLVDDPRPWYPWYPRGDTIARGEPHPGCTNLSLAAGGDTTPAPAGPISIRTCPAPNDLPRADADERLLSCVYTANGEGRAASMNTLGSSEELRELSSDEGARS